MERSVSLRQPRLDCTVVMNRTTRVPLRPDNLGDWNSTPTDFLIEIKQVCHTRNTWKRKEVYAVFDAEQKL
jgi:hypothetical protein